LRTTFEATFVGTYGGTGHCLLLAPSGNLMPGIEGPADTG